MVFDWHDEKDADCQRDRGFGFADAAGIFLGRRIERQDARHNYGEVRMVTTGEHDGLFYTLVYTDRQDADGELVRRIISARLANRKERKAWRA